MNICYDWIAEIVKVNELAIKQGKQIESIDLILEQDTEHDTEPPACGWSRIQFNYEPIGTEHKSWTYTHPER